LQSDKATSDFDQESDPESGSDAKVAEAEREELEEGNLGTRAEAELQSAREGNNGTLANGNATGIAAPLPTKHKDELFERVGSTSQKYDRLTVVLSDMARFVLTHRFGGVYLDADTLLLRDWEELFGWHGAFAYRWSRLEKYNTAVLKMQRGSALGNFLFRTAVANGLDFHPMTISRYTKDAGLEGLLLRLPDALFDPAWLNTEYYQRDRPPFPYLERCVDWLEDGPIVHSPDLVLTGFLCAVTDPAGLRNSSRHRRRLQLRQQLLDLMASSREPSVTSK
jgi:WD repeat and SOF domain-containing protein 1